MATDIFDSIKLQFEQFLSLISNVLAHEKEINIIQNKLRRHFNTTSSVYLCSTDFRSLLNRAQNLFNENDKSIKYFTLLASIDEELKKHSIKLSGSNRSSNEACTFACIGSVNATSSTSEKAVTTSSKSSTTRSITINQQNISPSVVEQTAENLLDTCSNNLLELNESQLINNDQITTDLVRTIECETKRKEKIVSLERRLSHLSDTIRQLEEEDMSLDEMNYCDLYVVESKLKKRAYETYTKLADLKNQSSSVKRILDQPVSLSACEIGHPLIIQALEEMVNQTNSLPCFDDIIDTVEKTSDKHKLDLSTDARKSLAEELFKIIGKKVKTRRMNDFNDIMNSRLPENYDIEKSDPVLNNIEIEKALIENERQAALRTEQILEEFSQIDLDLEAEDNIESSEESNDESDEEEKGAEEEKLESELTAETFDNKPEEIEYDIVDILPPFSSNSSSPASSIINESDEPAIEFIRNNDHDETKVEISLKDGTSTILSTVSISLKRTKRDSFDPILHKSALDDDTQQSQMIKKEYKIQTLVPRRRDYPSPSENLYNHRLSNNVSSVAQKRSISKDTEPSTTKKLKQEVDFIILD